MPTLTDLMKAAFGVVFGYDLDTAGEPAHAPPLPPSLNVREVAVFDEERKRHGSPSMDYTSLDDMECHFGYYPRAYFSLSGQVPLRTLVAWRSGRPGVV